MDEWKTIFKTLSNINRLKIIKLLEKRKKVNVSEIAKELDISIQATSNHLAVLYDLGVVKAKGKNNSVSYFLNQSMPTKFKSVLKLI